MVSVHVSAPFVITGRTHWLNTLVLYHGDGDSKRGKNSFHGIEPILWWHGWFREFGGLNSQRDKTLRDPEIVDLKLVILCIRYINAIKSPAAQDIIMFLEV